MPRSLVDKLHAAGQPQLLRFWDELSPESRSRLAAQIDAIDLNLVNQLYRQPTDEGDLARLAGIAEPPPAIRLDQDDPEFTVDEARAAGEAMLAAGKVGAVLVAGGQGSRLGSDEPKGMFPIGPVSAKSLFQVLLEKVLAVRQAYGRPVPLYLMTSPATHEATAAYLSEQQYFGLPKDEVQLFCQGQMPAVDAATGEILLAEKDSLALSPDGHGGMLAAMDAAGCLEDCGRRGVEQLFYFQVDNPLCTVCDPALLGFHQLHQSEYSLQVVAKDDPLERVGNLVGCDGALRIIEYSDLPEEAARQCNEDGSLKLWAGSIAVHVFDVDFLQRAAHRASALPYHRARKAVAFVDATGSRAEPDEANAIKFERFIFDLLPQARAGFAVEVDPAEAFAPVKNADGSARDTPRSCQAAWSALHRRWLRECGVEVADVVAVEISPLFALDPRQLATKPLPSVVSQDTYFC